jgi:hypothetical protein
LGFFASCVLEGYESQSPGDSSELPGYLDTSLPPEKNTIYYMAVHIHFLSDPPRQRYSTRESTTETRLLHADKELSSKDRPCLHVLSQRGRCREGDVCEEKYALVSTPATLLPKPPSTNTRTFSRYMRHLRVETRSRMVCNWLDDGRVDSEGNATRCSGYRAVVTTVDRHLYVAGVPWQPTAAAQVHDRR